MADSAITKKALAKALKQLMADSPFSKISISDICGLCGMNRKSFYYHFQDKHDLLNRIFDTEFLHPAQSIPDGETRLKLLCEYLYENREFYRHAFKIEGQNSLRAHFREVICEYLSESIKNSECDLTDDDLTLMHVLFFSDAFASAIERWISDRDCTSPDKFYIRLSSVCRLHGEMLIKQANKKTDCN